MLPVLSGDPLSWKTFWDSFSAAVDTSPTLGAIQKFNYLRAQLQGDAARTIAGLPLTEANYSHSISLLKERFGQPNKIQNAHMQAFLELPGPTNELSSLRLFYNLVEVHIRRLSSLGVSKESYGALLVPIVLAKLSIPTRKNLAQEHANLDWSTDELQTAILKEIRVMEQDFIPVIHNQAHQEALILLHRFMLGLREHIPTHLLIMVRRDNLVYTVRVTTLPVYVM